MSKVVRGFPYEVDFIPTATVCAIAVALQSADSVNVEFDDGNHEETKRQLIAMEEAGYVYNHARDCDHHWVVTGQDCPTVHAIGDDYFS